MRLELTKKGDYAVRAMIALARQGGGLRSARSIAEEMDIPPRFLPQVLAALTRAELVRAAQGRNGGYELVAPPGRTSLLAIVEAVEGPSRRETCVLRGGPCGSDGRCAVHDAFCAAEEGMTAALDSVTLADVSTPDAESVRAAGSDPAP
jgi:Rrf2 family protein